VPPFVWPLRTEVNVDELVHDAFVRADLLHEQAEAQEDMPPAEPNHDKMTDLHMSEFDMDQLLGESTTPVYENCRVNCL